MSGGDDWQAGDLALCVVGGFIDGDESHPTHPKAGALYTVETVGFLCFYHGVSKALFLKDGPRNRGGHMGWAVERFSKIHPHAPDAEDAETIALLNGKPVTVPA